MSDDTAPGSGTNDHPVLLYLAALEARRHAPPDFPNPERIIDGLASGEMVQAGDELRRQLAARTPGAGANIEDLEEGFVSTAREYGRRHGITYEGWLQAGVDPAVLARAGLRPAPG
jgi:hypothetical protein